MLVPPLGSWHPLLREILDLPLYCVNLASLATLRLGVLASFCIEIDKHAKARKWGQISPTAMDPPTARLKEEDMSEDLSVNFYGSELYLRVIRIWYVNQFQILCMICESVSVPVYNMYHTILPLVPDGTITFTFAFILIQMNLNLRSLKLSWFSCLLCDPPPPQFHPLPFNYLI